MTTEATDPLHRPSDPDSHWTTANLGEAMPGVATALSASVWGDSVHRGLVAGAFALGAISRAERDAFGRPGNEQVGLFHGRAAVNADFLALVGDRMPGTTGRQVVHRFFGQVPDTMSFHPTARRYPYAALGLPRAFAGYPGRARALATEYDAWWSTSITALAGGDPIVAARLLAGTPRLMRRAVIVQSVTVMTCVQPVYEALGAVVEGAGAGGFSILSAPPGGAESVVVADIWAASRGRLSVDQVVARHGFHGPGEGEVSARVWRDDPKVLGNLVEQYRARPDSASPHEQEARRLPERQHRERLLLAAVGPARRPVVRAVLALVARRIPLRGLAKRSMLQSIDVARACARVIGADLVHRGLLDDREDVFHLTVPEVLAPSGRSRQLVAERRRARREHAAARVPDLWRGDVDAAGSLLAPPPAAGGDGPEVIQGVGVSAGVVEGVVRVVTDPSFADVEPDEVLVAPTTDPSWASIMFVSSALVVDIGGPLSHAAVVARELGVPCVVNTRSGSRVLHTGDRVRVDGGTGRIEILERA
ncbi:MAG TPA: PEP-utilizing enzyme [Pseudonocardia sp.]